MDITKTIIKNIKKACDVLVSGTKISIQAGDSIVINGSRVQVGDKSIDVTDRVIRIEITGDVGSVSGPGDVVVTGDVNGDIDVSSGDVDVSGNVSGDIDCSCGNITIKGSVGGDIDSSCGNVRVGK